MKIVTNLKTIIKKLNYFIQRTPAAGLDVIEDTARRIQERMNVRREKSDYPVTWDSEKQRRAFFATNGFGHGIPYKRTGLTVWSVERKFNEVNLFAPHPAGPVFGRMPDGGFWQSRVHRQTWPALLPVLVQEIAKIPAEISKRLKILINE
jgi:hypothetical protein